MANRYWVLNTGTWDNSTTTNWSTSSGGLGGASVPGASDDVIFDANSCLLSGTVTPNYDLSVKSITMGAFTGTLDFSANNNSPTMQTWNNTGTGTRTLHRGSGTWTITGFNGTIWNCGTSTNLTEDGTGIINCTYAGSTGHRMIQSGGASHPYTNVKISAGTDSIWLSGDGSTSDSAGYLDFTGFSGVFSTNDSYNNMRFSGNLILSPTMTVNGGNGKTWTFNSTSAQTITSNGIKLNVEITFNGVGGTWTLQDDLDMSGASIRTLGMTNGILNANGHTVTCGAVGNNADGTKGIGNGNFILVGTGSGNRVWGTGTITGTNIWTILNNTNIKITDSSSSDALIFQGGGLTYNNLWFSRGASTASNSVTYSNTFNDFKDDGTAAHSIIFTHGNTTGFTTWNINGADASNLITITSDTAATFTLKNNGTAPVFAQYLDISKSVAT